jgi:uncharacterized protein
MIAYFDTSALVPLLIEEPGTVTARRLWNAAYARVSNRLLYVEVSAVLAQAHRVDRLTEAQFRDAVELLDDLWERLDVVNVVETLVYEAAGLAQRCGLRGSDAMHCASARRFASDDVVVVSANHDLIQACQWLGMATAALC